MELLKLVQWCSRNSKSHFARNLLAITRTNLTLFVRLGTKSDLLIENIAIRVIANSEHYCMGQPDQFKSDCYGKVFIKGLLIQRSSLTQMIGSFY